MVARIDIQDASLNTVKHKNFKKERSFDTYSQFRCHDANTSA